MRHAKSSWTSGAATDHARPLNARGRRDAPRIAAVIRDRGWMPAVVLSSDAARTQETWSTMADLMPASNVRITRGLYHAGVGAMMAELSGLDDTLPSSMILAHNPGCEDVVGWLSGQPTRMTTANAALLKGGGSSWLDALLPGTWTLEAVLRPKEL